MQREIDVWIENNNPYGKEHPCKNCSNNIWNQCQTNPIDCERYKELTNLKHGYIRGAKAMYTHLEERSRVENDAAFLLGMESAKGVQLFGIEQPPTKEQILKVISIYFQNYDIQRIGWSDFTKDKKLVEQCVEQILKHWV